MKIDITQQHIDNGNKNCESCPIALAVNEVLPDDYYARVDYDLIELINKTNIDKRYFIVTPNIAYKFMRLNDSDMPRKPFSFDIYVEIIDHYE